MFAGVSREAGHRHGSPGGAAPRPGSRGQLPDAGAGHLAAVQQADRQRGGGGRGHVRQELPGVWGKLSVRQVRTPALSDGLTVQVSFALTDCECVSCVHKKVCLNF